MLRLLLVATAAAETSVQLAASLLKGDIIQMGRKQRVLTVALKNHQGVPHVTDSLFPMQGYTDIQPGGSVTVHYQFTGGGDSGEHISRRMIWHTASPRLKKTLP